MIVTLVMQLCLNADCSDKQVWQYGRWEGAAALAICESERDVALAELREAPGAVARFECEVSNVGS